MLKWVGQTSRDSDIQRESWSSVNWLSAAYPTCSVTIALAAQGSYGHSTDTKCATLNVLCYFSFWKTTQVNCRIHRGTLYIHHSLVHCDFLFTMTFLTQLPGSECYQCNSGTVLLFASWPRKKYCHFRLLNFNVITMFDVDRWSGEARICFMYSGKITLIKAQ